MGKFAAFIIRHDRLLFIVMLLCGVLGLMLMPMVEINSDMTRYLPKDSSMNRGIEVIKEEFGNLAMPSTIRVMLTGTGEDKARETARLLGGLENCESAVVTAGALTDQGEEAWLITVSTSFDYSSKEGIGLEKDVKAVVEPLEGVVVSDSTSTMQIPLFIYVLAVLVLVLVLFAFCASWAEPILFLFTIGCAILINMGSNLILGSVSYVTYSLGALFQLVLSMDYSIILMNRFRQEKAVLADNRKAMEKALAGSFTAITGSAFTTMAGLVVLVFMRFRIGADMGIIMAKGVLCSLIGVFFMLPYLIVRFESLIEKSAKGFIRPTFRGLSSFTYRFKKQVLVFFLLLFALVSWIQAKTGVSYSLSPEDKIAEVFPVSNPVIMVYGNEDREKAQELAAQLERRPGIVSVMSYDNTLGKKMDAGEMTDFMSSMADEYLTEEQKDGDVGSMLDMLTPSNMNVLYTMYGAGKGEDPILITPAELVRFISEDVVNNPLAKSFLGEGMAQSVAEFDEKLSDAQGQLMGPEHSLMMINTTLPVEGEDTGALLDLISDNCGAEFTADHHLIGNSPMAWEMEKSFRSELMLITALSVLAIFLVVLISFRRPVIPLILVMTVQCGVFMAISTVRLMGYNIYYLAYLIVQCMLMGATVDYGILMSNYYCELRKTEDIRNAVRYSLERSIHTVLTSGLFMILGTGVIAISPADPTICQICMTISIGAAAVTFLVIFILPSLLSALDRLVTGKKTEQIRR